jgi:hypothetical protein
MDFDQLYRWCGEWFDEAIAAFERHDRDDHDIAMGNHAIGAAFFALALRTKHR